MKTVTTYLPIAAALLFAACAPAELPYTCDDPQLPVDSEVALDCGTVQFNRELALSVLAKAGYVEVPPIRVVVRDAWTLATENVGDQEQVVLGYYHSRPLGQSWIELTFDMNSLAHELLHHVSPGDHGRWDKLGLWEVATQYEDKYKDPTGRLVLE